MLGGSQQHKVGSILRNFAAEDWLPYLDFFCERAVFGVSRAVSELD